MSTWGQTSAECGGDRHLVGVVQMAQPLIHESGAVMMSHSSLHLTLLGSWLSLALKGLCCSTFHHLLESPTPFCSSSSTFSWHVECSVFVGVCAAVSPELLELSLWCGRRRSEEKRRKEQGQQVYSFFVFKCHMSVGRRGLHLDMPSFLLTFFFLLNEHGLPRASVTWQYVNSFERADRWHQIFKRPKGKILIWCDEQLMSVMNLVGVCLGAADSCSVTAH